MRLRLLALGLVAAAGIFAVPSANAAVPEYDHRCGGKSDTFCYDTDCSFIDCTTSNCVVYLNYLNDPYLDICVGQTHQP